MELGSLSSRARRKDRATRRPPPGLAALALAAAMLAPMAWPEPAPAATYYVDASHPACSADAAGTEAQPYCSISSAVAKRAAPGNTILVKPGLYREQVDIRASGTPGSPIVVRALGPGVILDGADDFADPSAWQPAGGSEWVAQAVTWQPLQVFVDGSRLTPSTAAPGSLPVNRFTWRAGEGLYVNLGGGNPGLRAALVGRRNHGFNMAGRSWIRVEGFTVARSESRGIFLQGGCTNITIAGNFVTQANASGIQAVGGSQIVIEQNRIANNGPHGIGLTAGATNCTIRDNESFGSADPDIRRADGFYFYQAPGNLVYRNRSHGNQDSGFHFGGGSNDCVAFNNRSWNNGDHGYDHLGASGTIHSNDVAYGNYRDGFSIEGGATHTRLSNCIAVNNGLTNDNYNLWVEPGSETGFVSDHNVFWNGTSHFPIRYVDVRYPSLGDYRTASGQDANSIEADPRFVDPEGGDFRLRTGSPAIDAGNSAAPHWPAADVDGNARTDVPAIANTGAGPIGYADIGPLEYVPVAPVARLSLSPASGTAPLAVTADASASSDSAGVVASYRFDFGDGAVVGPQASPLAVHSYNAGERAVTVTVTDADGVVDTVSNAVSVASSLRAALAVRPATGNEPLRAQVDASGTVDTYRPIVSYRFDFGDGSKAGPQPSATVGHDYAPGTWLATVTAENDFGETSTASWPVIVAEVGPGPNWVGNPSWETDTVGWAPENATLSRVTGGFDGTRALHVQGPVSTEPFGVTDAPDWVGATPAANARLRFTAWVRSPTATGSVRLRVREADSTGRQLGPVVLSYPVRLSPTWQRVAVEHLCEAAGSTLDLRILDYPEVAGESFLVDNVSVHTVVGNSPFTPPGAVLGLAGPIVFPSPMAGRATLRFALSQSGPLKVEIYDVTGRVLRTLADDPQALPGQFEYPLDLETDQGRSSGSGVYFYRITAREGTVTGRFLAVR